MSERIRRHVSCLLILALVTGMLSGIIVPMEAQAAGTSDPLVVEVTTNIDGNEETRQGSGISLTSAINDSGVSRSDVTKLKILSGTMKENDWFNLCYKRESGENFSKLTSILVSDEARGEGKIPSPSNSAAFPETLEVIMFPVGVTEIGEEAFTKCKNLQKVTIPPGVTSIGMQAFKDCTSLQEVVLPDEVTRIGWGAFWGCTSLERISIPEGIPYIAMHTFSGCSSLKEITIPKGVMAIEERAFYYCSSLEKVVLPDGLTKIGNNAFEMCGTLKELDIPDSVTEIRGYAFQNCGGLKQLKIPDSVSVLGAGIFSMCGGLEELTIPSGIRLDKSEYLLSARDPLFSLMFFGCQLKALNIIVKEGEAITPVSVAEVSTFGGGYAENCGIFFCLEDGTPLSEQTTPTLEEASAAYLAVEEDGDSTDNLWYGWKIGKMYQVENRLTNLSTSNDKTVWRSCDGNYETTLSVEQSGGVHRVLPQSIQVKIGGRTAIEGQGYTYDDSTGNLVILEEAIDGDMTITAEGGIVYCPIDVRSSGGGKVALRTTGISVVTDLSATAEVGGGNDIVFTFMPEEGCHLLSVTIDGEKQEVEGNTYTLSDVQSAHTVFVLFSELPTESPEPTQSPTPPPSSPGPTGTLEPTQTPEASGTPGPTKTPTPTPKPPVISDSPETPKPSQSPKPTQIPEASGAPDRDVSQIADGLGVSPETAAKIQAAAKELDVSMDTILVTEQTITAQKTDEDLKGAYFARIQARAAQITENNIKLSWNRVKGADGYEVYGNRCNTRKWIYEYKKIKTIENAGKKSHIERKCKKGIYYKYMVRAYKIIDGKKVTIAVSKTIHVTTNGGKYGNAGSVKVNKDNVTLKAGKKFRLKASEVKMKNSAKKLRHHREVSYESSDPRVAIVTKKGRIKAKNKGKCTIFAYAQSGVYKKVKVKVK